MSNIPRFMQADGATINVGEILHVSRITGWHPEEKKDVECTQVQFIRQGTKTLHIPKAEFDLLLAEALLPRPNIQLTDR
jgi:hypothetical protein